MSEPLWSLEAVAIHARRAARLQDLTLRIGQGITAILGPSGAGKTSLCNLLVGFERPHRGRMVWRPPGRGGQLPLYWSSADGLWPQLDALGHLAAVAPATPRRPLPDVLARFALDHRAQARPAELSAGERERLGVARAIASEALVLVLDEPFAHVDAGAATRCWASLMEDVRAQGTSLIYSTHSPDRVIGLAGSVICLHEGRLLEHGAVDDLYHRPATRQLAGCLGEANWFSAEDRPWFPAAEVLGCVRPERLLISQDAGGQALVRTSTFHGAYAEVEATLPAQGLARTFIHRPVDALAAGDRVRLAVRPAPAAPPAAAAQRVGPPGRGELPAAGLLVLLALALGLAGCGDAKPLAFHEERSWNLPPVAATQPAPRGLGRMGDDQVLVLDTAGRVMVYGGGGALVRQWTMPAYDIGRPEGVVQLRDGRIAVADTHYHRVVLFAADGTVSALFGSEGMGPGQFLFPVGVATDPGGNLYVSEYGGNDRVQKFSPALRPLAVFGGFGIQAGRFQRPQGLAWHEGKVFVADAMNNRIQVFHDDGTFIGVVGGEHPPELDLPYNLALAADGSITAVEYSGNRITRLDGAGAIIGRYGRAGAGEGQFSTPWGMTVDGHGRVWVADTGNRRLVELHPMIGAAVIRLARRLVPAPRRPVTRLEAWPLALFLLLAAAALVTVEQARLLRFASPWAFAWLAVTPWIWWLHAAGWGGLHGARAILALFIRLLLVATLALALAEPRAVRTSDDLCLVYCLDASDSIGDGAGGQARQWMLETVGAKPKQDQAGLVIFGRDAAVELPPSQSFPFQAFTTRVAHDGTDIEKALMLAAAVLPEDRPGRIVLISDGVATQGNVERALDEMVRRNIAVDVLPIQYDHTQEVWVEKLDLPRQVRPGETYEAGVVLGSLQDGHGDLVLRENGREIARQGVQYRAGKTRFTLPLYLRGPGYYEYVATIEPAPGYDSLSENNSAMGYLYLQGEGRILVLTDPDGDPADSTALVQALRRTNRLIEVKSAYDCPTDELALLPYDSVILVNAPADAFNAPQQQALHDGVYNLGVGLLMIGGKNGFGPGGWNRTPVEEALPVSMDITQRKVMPKGALAIILHTCEFGDGNTWAKRITKQAIKVLGARDEIGAIDFDAGGKDQWIFPLTPAGQYDQLEPLIERASPSDMPSFVSTMTMAYKGLIASDAATKHLIIISDGDPSPPPPTLLSDYIQAKISVSVVSIFPHGNQEVAAFRAIAEATGGRAYFPQDASRLPAIFIKEAKTLKRSQIQNVTFTPKSAFPSPILKGITAVPPLHGYVLTTIKARAQTILTGPPTDEDNPLLATWRFGVGAAAAFTSDLAPNWGVEWVQWDRYQALIEQLLKAIGRGEAHSDLSLAAEAEGERGVVTVEDHHAEPGFLTVQATIVKPSGGSTTIDLRQIGPGRYQGAFPLEGKGRYQVMAAGSNLADQAGRQRLERVAGGFIVAYSAEYLRFRADPMVLAHIAERTGGRELSGSESGKDLFGVEHQPRASSKPVFDVILVILACLLPLDVALRRVQFDPGALLARLRRKPAPASSPTMGALLGAKQRAAVPRAAPAAPPGAPAAPPPGQPAAAHAPSRPPAAPPAAPPAVPPAAAGSMASRLLEAKRKRQGNDEQKP